jgi:hypothetical protein
MNILLYIILCYVLSVIVTVFLAAKYNNGRDHSYVRLGWSLCPIFNLVAFVWIIVIFFYESEIFQNFEKWYYGEYYEKCNTHNGQEQNID